MIKTIKTIIASALLLFAFASPVLAPAVANAALCDQGTSIAGCAGSGVTATDPTGGSTQGSAEDRVTKIAQDVIRIFSYVVGIISVIMVIVGGFQYVTSGGDSGKVTTAKNTIMYALIGIVIVALSQIMVNFVLAKFVSTTS